MDTDVASFIFKWHPEFAPLYIAIVRGSELAVSFMTLAEMRQGALDANRGPRKCDVLEDGIHQEETKFLTQQLDLANSIFFVLHRK